MKNHENVETDIEKRLADWQVVANPEPDLKQRVLARIDVNEAEKHSGVSPWLAFVRLYYANRVASLIITCSILIVATLSFIALHERKMRMEAESCRVYFLIINPVEHASISGGTNRNTRTKEPSVADMLGWMKDRLGLSREQFAMMVDLHRNYSDKFASLYLELCEIDDEYRIFENSRINDETIDFMAFYDLLQKRDTARADSRNTSKELVDLIFEILTPEQKTKFMSLSSKERGFNENNSLVPDTHAGA